MNRTYKNFIYSISVEGKIIFSALNIKAVKSISAKRIGDEKLVSTLSKIVKHNVILLYFSLITNWLLKNI